MKPKFFIVTTIPVTLGFFRGQLKALSDIFDVTAVSSQRAKLEAFGVAEGVATRYIPMERPISPKDPWSLLRFIWLLAKERPRLVHGNTPKGSFLSMIAAWITRRPIRVYMCHGLRYQGYRGAMRTLLMTMERVSCRCATHVIAVSQGVRATLVDDGVCPGDKVVVVGHGSAGGIDFNAFDRAKIESAALPGAKKVNFLFVGRIVKDKGIDELASAFARLASERDDVALYIVGPFEDAENPVAPVTRELLQSHPHIHALGPQRDVKPYLKGASALVLPSYREGLPTVPIEAGVLGVPSIVSDIPGCREVIADGENGLRVRPRDVDSLYEALKWAADHPAELHEMGERGCLSMADRYDRPAVWARYRDYYLSLLANTQ